MAAHTLSRRTALGLAATLTGGALLSSCTTTAPPPPPTQNSAVKLPTYVPRELVKPDLAGDDTGIIPPGFFSYPKSLAPVNQGPPGRGGEVSLMMAGSGQGAPPLPPENKFWAELNRRLNVNLTAQIAPNAGDYLPKLQTTLASGDLPDIIQLFHSYMPRLPELAAAKLQDISEFVSGDAVKEFPNLAAINSTAWRNSMINGRFYGIGLAQVIPAVMLVRSDIAAARGFDVAEITTFDAYLEMCRAVTNPREGKFAVAYPSGLSIFLKESCGVPNNWREEGGRLTWAYETDEIKDALTAFVKLRKEGVLHPDAFTNSNDIYTWLVSGRTAMMENSLNNLSYIAGLAGAPDATFAALPAPSYNGATPVSLGTSGVSTVTALKKTEDKERVRELLRILDWMAAPFGSEEQQFCFYGLPGVDFELTGGEPVKTRTGENETRLYLFTLSRGNPHLYFGNRADDVRKMHSYAEQVKPRVIFDPTLTLYSPTRDRQWEALVANVSAVEDDIIQGRKELSALDDVIATWRQEGGDKVRSELEAALEKQ